MKDTITFQCGPTFALIQPFPINHPAATAVRSFTQKYLTDYEIDQRFKRRVPKNKYMFYDPETTGLRIPINFVDTLDEYLKASGFHTERTVMPVVVPAAAVVKVNSKITPREHQIPAIEYLAASTSPPRRGLNFQTGEGKSLTAIMTASQVGHVTMIICSGLVDQWLEVYAEKTDAKDDCWVIKTFDTLSALMKCPYKPKVFICSLETLRAYVQNKGAYAGLPYTYPQFLQHYGIGVKIIDEVHENFLAINFIDLFSNVPVNIYLTATFYRAAHDTRRIFDVIYPEDMRFGGENYKKYVNAFFYAYVGEVNERKVVRSRGYSQPRYENEIFRRSRVLTNYFNTVVLPLLNAHFINRRKPGERALLFFSTIQMVNEIVTFIKQAIPELNTIGYVSSVKDRQLSDDVDIFVSTHGSLGTGSDIPKLITVINCISFQSQGAVIQVLGRLRYIEGTAVEYVDTVDHGISAQVRHYQTRKEILQRCCLSYAEYSLY